MRTFDYKYTTAQTITPKSSVMFYHKCKKVDHKNNKYLSYGTETARARRL